MNEVMLRARQNDSDSSKTRNFAEPLRASLSPSLEESLELCEEIIGNTRSAVEVLDDLLNYDKIEVGALVLDPSFVALDYILEMVMKPFSGPAKAKDVSIVTNTAGYASRAILRSPLHGGKFASLRVLGDKVRLQQVIRNLISNALKFTPQGGTITVTLEWVEGGLQGSELSPELSCLVQDPSALTSTRRADNSLRSITLNSFNSLAAANPKVAQKYKPAEVPPALEVLDVCDEVDDREPTENASDKSQAATGSSQAANRKADKDYCVSKIVRGSYLRSPMEPGSSHRCGSVRLCVHDSGAGLTEQQLSQICSEGVQFNANQLQAGQGSGLGLFIAKGKISILMASLCYFCRCAQFRSHLTLRHRKATRWDHDREV
jgi:signal transduction histidine kinase